MSQENILNLPQYSVFTKEVQRNAFFDCKFFKQANECLSYSVLFNQNQMQISFNTFWSVRRRAKPAFTCSKNKNPFITLISSFYDNKLKIKNFTPRGKRVPVSLRIKTGKRLIVFYDISIQFSITFEYNPSLGDGIYIYILFIEK